MFDVTPNASPERERERVTNSEGMVFDRVCSWRNRENGHVQLHPDIELKELSMILNVFLGLLGFL